MTAELFTLRTAHGTILAVQESDGLVVHAPPEPRRDGLAPLLAWLPTSLAESCLLANPAAAVPLHIAGDHLRRPVLAYRCQAAGDGMVALVHPSTGRYLTAHAGEAGMVDAAAEHSAAPALFSLLAAAAPAPPALAMLIARDSGQGLLDDQGLDALPAAMVATLFRLLPPERCRDLVARLQEHPDYETIFPDLRAHLSRQSPMLWGDTTRKSLEFWIKNCGYEVGEHSYGAPVIWSGLLHQESTHLTIGKYCAIAGNIDIVMANHRVHFASTYPFVIYREFWPGVSGAYSDHKARPVIIGNDVWIGAHACLLPGTRIGDGAVIGAYALVRGNVPPYAIVNGNPGRIVGYRFDQATIGRLLQIRWWEWPDWRVDRYLPLMMNDDIEAFLVAAEGEMPAAPPPVHTPPPPGRQERLQQLLRALPAAAGSVSPELRDILGLIGELLEEIERKI